MGQRIADGMSAMTTEKKIIKAKIGEPGLQGDRIQPDSFYRSRSSTRKAARALTGRSRRSRTASAEEIESATVALAIKQPGDTAAKCGAAVPQNWVRVRNRPQPAFRGSEEILESSRCLRMDEPAQFDRGARELPGRRRQRGVQHRRGESAFRVSQGCGQTMDEIGVRRRFGADRGA